MPQEAQVPDIRWLMSGMAWRIIVRRSMPSPNAKPEYFSGSTLPAASTLGWTMPQPQISIQPVRLHVEQPAPPQMRHWKSSSSPGSTNGK